MSRRAWPIISPCTPHVCHTTSLVRAFSRAGLTGTPATGRIARIEARRLSRRTIGLRDKRPTVSTERRFPILVPMHDDEKHSTASLPIAFFLTPFSAEGAGGEDADRFQQVGDAIRQAAKAAGVQLRRADDIFAAGIIIDQIRDAIEQADVVVAVCTGRNPNVFYELGLAHEKGHNPILVAASSADLPFDIAHRRAQLYGGSETVDTLAARVERAILETLQGARRVAVSPAIPSGDAIRSIPSWVSELMASRLGYVISEINPTHNPHATPTGWAELPLLQVRVVSYIGDTKARVTAVKEPQRNRFTAALASSLATSNLRHFAALPAASAVTGLPPETAPPDLDQWVLNPDDIPTQRELSYRLGGDASAGVSALASVKPPWNNGGNDR